MNIKGKISQIHKSRQLQKKIMTIAAILTAIFVICLWLYFERYVSTDDSYVNANVVQIAPRVTGQVTKLYIVNNQFVHKGQVLFELDNEPYLVTKEKAQAQLAMNQANYKNAQINAKRLLELVDRKVLSPQAGDNAEARLESSFASVQLAKAMLAQAELDLQYTRITAPTTGWVTNVTVRVGDNIEKNQPLFALISNEEFWVDANYKETQLEDVKPGQAATIEVDMYPNYKFNGVVESISGGSGNAFSLLPPQNATGNWVKITQRVPVRVHVMNIDPQHPLRIGTSATVTIDTHSVTKKAKK